MWSVCIYCILYMGHLGLHSPQHDFCRVCREFWLDTEILEKSQTCDSHPCMWWPHTVLYLSRVTALALHHWSSSITVMVDLLLNQPRRSYLGQKQFVKPHSKSVIFYLRQHHSKLEETVAVFCCLTHHCKLEETGIFKIFFQSNVLLGRQIRWA